jgi:hypothetical protein
VPRTDTASSPNPYQPASEPGDLLRVSTYDQVAGLLVSLLMMVGLCVGVLVVIWITTRVFTRPAPAEVFLVEEESGPEEAESSATEIREPGLEELDLVTPDVQDTLAAVTDAVSSVAASLDAIETAVSSRGSGGDGRKQGSGVIPRWQRWEIRYVSTTLDSYAKQLEYFGIELAALGGGQATVDYARFSNGRPQRRAADSATSDERLYFIWQGGKFKEQDRALLARAGINMTGRVICQFYPPEIENQLAVLEQNELGGRPLKDVRRTTFGVRPAGRGFEFHVSEIQWRR